MSAFLGLLFLVLAVYLFNKSWKAFKLKNKENNLKSGTPQSDNKDIAIHIDSNNNFSNIRGNGVQILESLHIVNNSSSLDTINGRYSLLEDRISELKQSSSSRTYNTEIQFSIDSYKSMYYNRMITNVELSALVNPNSFDLKSFYSEAILNCFIRYYENQVEQINSLKREDAKTRRKLKIQEVLLTSIEELNRECSDTKNYKFVLEQLNNFKEVIASSENNLELMSSIHNISTDVKTEKEDFSSFAEKKEIGKIKNGFILNPKSNLELTLVNSDERISQEVLAILNNEELYDYKKQNRLVALFAAYNLTIKEIEEYKNKYQSIYNDSLTKLKNESSEWKEAGEKDKEDILKEFREVALEGIFEKANCNLEVLFEDEPADITIDDELIKEYGFENIKTYLQYSNKTNKVRVVTNDNYSRSSFEELVKLGLAIRGTQIPIDEILMTLTLKELNDVYKEDATKFTRKNKAVQYILEQPDYEEKLSSIIAFRELFKLVDLPEKYSEINLDELSKAWRYTTVIVELLLQTYNSSIYYNRRTENSSYTDGFKLECWSNDDKLCSRAKELITKNYPKTNPPKVPFHVGCNCTIDTIYK